MHQQVFFSSCILFMCISIDLFHITVCIIHLVRTTAQFCSLYRQESLAAGIAKVGLIRFAPQSELMTATFVLVYSGATHVR